MWCLRRVFHPRCVLTKQGEHLGEHVPVLFATPDEAAYTHQHYGGPEFYDLIEYDKPMPSKVVRTKARGAI